MEKGTVMLNLQIDKKCGLMFASNQYYNNDTFNIITGVTKYIDDHDKPSNKKLIKKPVHAQEQAMVH